MTIPELVELVEAAIVLETEVAKIKEKIEGYPDIMEKIEGEYDAYDRLYGDDWRQGGKW